MSYKAWFSFQFLFTFALVILYFYCISKIVILGGWQKKDCIVQGNIFLRCANDNKLFETWFFEYPEECVVEGFLFWSKEKLIKSFFSVKWLWWVKEDLGLHAGVGLCSSLSMPCEGLWEFNQGHFWLVYFLIIIVLVNQSQPLGSTNGAFTKCTSKATLVSVSATLWQGKLHKTNALCPRFTNLQGTCFDGDLSCK